MTDHELRDELLARAAADWRHAEVFFAVVEADRQVGSELDELLANPATPLLAVLREWEACPDEGARLVQVIAENSRWLRDVVDERGWPGLATVDADGADAAWLLAQHADLENDLRRGWVAPLADAVRAGEADPRHLACLVDRIAVVDGRPQVFGTVALLVDGETVFPHPVEDAACLDGRRTEIGLPTVDADALLLAQGEIVPFGPDRQDHPLMRWPRDAT